MSNGPDELLERYVDLLLDANRRMNLTRIATRQEAMAKHIADAMTLLPFLPPGPHRIADVGSGGGVPGIPIAIARPDAAVVLIESTKKKAAFLRDAVRELGVSNVTVDGRRAEDVGRSERRESFDVVVARAVATMDWLAEWCLPLVRTAGNMLAMKGPKVIDELPIASRAIKLLGGGEPVIHPTRLPGGEGHVIVEIRKLRKTDARYPRPATIAKGKPIR
jgi:16S rRNA (guanine527-N7)-methyltransferase